MAIKKKPPEKAPGGGVEANVEFPEKLAFMLTEQWRFKVLWGGRDSLKSWTVARAALIRAASEPTRVLCCREIESSVEESIYQLLKSQIEMMGLSYFFDVQRTHIIGRKHTAAEGSVFAFAGLRHNVEGLKSYEGFDIAIVEEARNVTRPSWDALENTIRRKGSEIWVVFNPELATDDTYKKFITSPTRQMKVVHLTWRDNPWASEVLAAGREQMRLERPDDYECIWEGQPRSSLVDAVYADELRAAQKEGRITRVPYESAYPVHTYWDLGYGNYTSIWMMQRVGMEWHAIRFMQNQNKTLQWYVAEMQKLPYVWGTDFLPHDGHNNQLVGLSVEAQLKQLMRIVEIVPRSDANTGINAARSVFPTVWFDEENCGDGLQCLRNYKWKKNQDGVVTAKEPLHDEWSDGADAFRCFAMARTRAFRRPALSRTTYMPRPMGAPAPSNTGWMR